MTGTSDLVVPTSNCILFTYDVNKNGVLPPLGTPVSDERFGYRLSGGRYKLERQQIVHLVVTAAIG